MATKSLILMLSLLLAHSSGQAQKITSLSFLYTDGPYITTSQSLHQSIFYTSDSSFTANLTVNYFFFTTDTDSTLLTFTSIPKAKFRKGNHCIKFKYNNTDSNCIVNPDYLDILKTTNEAPPGAYKLYLTVATPKDTTTITFHHHTDSLLSPHSHLRRDIDKCILPSQYRLSGKQWNAGIAQKKYAHLELKINNTIKSYGLTATKSVQNDRNSIDLFYHNWYIGRYQLDRHLHLTAFRSVSPHSPYLSDPQPHKSPYHDVSTDQLDHPSLASQYQQINTQKTSKNELTGDIQFITSAMSGTDQNSGINANYAETRAHLELPIIDFPISIDALYTTQDVGRKIKSSYIKIHYDVEKVKEELANSISSYKSKYTEVRAKASGMHNIYTSVLSGLEAQKKVLENEMRTEIANKEKKQREELNDEISNPVNVSVSSPLTLMQAKTIDSIEVNRTNEARITASKQNNKISTEQQSINEKKRKIELLEKKIQTYQTLLAQNATTNHFDSVFGYDQIKNLTQGSSETSYKKMVKKGSNLLPTNKVKGFAAGVSNLDLGMFSKTASKFTMNGQMVTGIDMSYDFGFCETGILAGTTEYIGRDGNIDKYACYSGKAVFSELNSQKTSLIYYAYAPSKTDISADAFYRNSGRSAPGFFQQVNILSLSHSGIVSKNITLNGEIATSIRKSDQDNKPQSEFKDRLAYDLNLDANIPRTPIHIESGYTKTGKHFENNTLPIVRSGTEQFKVAITNEFFQAHLLAGINYNYLIQQNFKYTNTNTRWGFDIRSNFKRYPNLSLSYKPFSNFRLASDTFAIPQRPLLGSVFTGRLSWQKRKNEKSLRLSAIYTTSHTEFDTIKSGNDIIQLSAIYNDRKLNSMIALGHTSTTGSNLSAYSINPASMYLFNLSVAYTLSSVFSVGASQDLGFSKEGVCKVGLNIGGQTQFKKVPLGVRLNARFSNFQVQYNGNWNQIYGGSLDLVYKLKASHRI